jgi:hypothetical protein
MINLPQDNMNSVSNIQDLWTGKICIKDRNEVFPAHGTANEPTRLELDHSCLTDAKVKYAWICTPTPPCKWVECPVFKLNVWWHTYGDLLWLHNNTDCTRQLSGVVWSQMMLFHMRHDINLLFLISFVCTCYVIR